MNSAVYCITRTLYGNKIDKRLLDRAEPEPSGSRITLRPKDDVRFRGCNPSRDNIRGVLPDAQLHARPQTCARTAVRSR